MDKNTQLPEGWVTKKSKSHPDKVYYFNINTGESSWEFPDVILAGHRKTKSPPLRPVIKREPYGLADPPASNKRKLSTTNCISSPPVDYNGRSRNPSTSKDNHQTLTKKCKISPTKSSRGRKSENDDKNRSRSKDRDKSGKSKERVSTKFAGAFENESRPNSSLAKLNSSNNAQRHNPDIIDLTSPKKKKKLMPGVIDLTDAAEVTLNKKSKYKQTINAVPQTKHPPHSQESYQKMMIKSKETLSVPPQSKQQQHKQQLKTSSSNNIERNTLKSSQCTSKDTNKTQKFSSSQMQPPPTTSKTMVITLGNQRSKKIESVKKMESVKPKNVKPENVNARLAVSELVDVKAAKRSSTEPYQINQVDFQAELVDVKAGKRSSTEPYRINQVDFQAELVDVKAGKRSSTEPYRINQVNLQADKPSDKSEIVKSVKTDDGTGLTCGGNLAGGVDKDCEISKKGIKDEDLFSLGNESPTDSFVNSDNEGRLKMFIGNKEKLLSIQSWIDNLQEGSDSPRNEFYGVQSTNVESSEVKNESTDSGFLSPCIKAEREWPDALKSNLMSSRDLVAMEVETWQPPEVDTRVEESMEVDIDGIILEARELIKSGSAVCETPNEEWESPISAGPIVQSAVIVIDTNIFLSNLSQVDVLKDYIIPDLGKPTLFIPWIVLRELDVIKENFGGKSKNVQDKARKAIWLLRSFLSKKLRNVRGQTPRQEEEASREFKASCNDDSVLQACLQCKKRYDQCEVILLTNDNNLIVKAMVNRVTAYSSLEIMDALKTLKSQVKHPTDSKSLHVLSSQTSTNINTNSTTMCYNSFGGNSQGFNGPNTTTHCDNIQSIVPEMPSAQCTRLSSDTQHVPNKSNRRLSGGQCDYKGIMGDQTRLSHPTQNKCMTDRLLQEEQNYSIDTLLEDIYHKLVVVLKAGFGKVLEEEMKLAYDDIWLQIVIKKPPWSFLDILECWKKHWRGVFGMVFRRSMITTVENLYTYFQSNRPRCVKFLFDICCDALVILRECLKRNRYGDIMFGIKECVLCIYELCEGLLDDTIPIQSICSLNDYLKTKLAPSTLHYLISPDQYPPSGNDGAVSGNTQLPVTTRTFVSPQEKGEGRSTSVPDSNRLPLVAGNNVQSSMWANNNPPYASENNVPLPKGEVINGPLPSNYVIPPNFGNNLQLPQNNVFPFSLQNNMPVQGSVNARPVLDSENNVQSPFLGINREAQNPAFQGQSSVPGNNILLTNTGNLIPPQQPGNGVNSNPSFVPGNSVNNNPTFIPGNGVNNNPIFIPGNGVNNNPTFIPGNGVNNNPIFIPGNSVNNNPTFIPGNNGPPWTGPPHTGNVLQSQQTNNNLICYVPPLQQNNNNPLCVTSPVIGQPINNQIDSMLLPKQVNNTTINTAHLQQPTNHNPVMLNGQIIQQVPTNNQQCSTQVQQMNNNNPAYFKGPIIQQANNDNQIHSTQLQQQNNNNQVRLNGPISDPHLVNTQSEQPQGDKVAGELLEHLWQFIAAACNRISRALSSGCTGDAEKILQNILPVSNDLRSIYVGLLGVPIGELSMQENNFSQLACVCNSFLTRCGEPVNNKMTATPVHFLMLLSNPGHRSTLQQFQSRLDEMLRFLCNCR